LFLQSNEIIALYFRSVLNTHTRSISKEWVIISAQHLTFNFITAFYTTKNIVATTVKSVTLPQIVFTYRLELRISFETSRPVCYNVVFSLVSVIVSRSTAVENIQDVFLVSERGGRPYGHFSSIWTDQVCPGAAWSVIGRLDRRTSVTFNWSADVSSTNEFQRANVTFR
jgi:hypothetical protein